MVHCGINGLFATLLLTILAFTQIGICTGSRVRRMVHGTKFNEKSPIVLLHIKELGSDNRVAKSTCSGSLITAQHVLSAAHCFTVNNGSSVINKKIVELHLYIGLLRGNRDLKRFLMRGSGRGRGRGPRRGRAVHGSAKYTVGLDSISIQKDWYHSISYKRDERKPLSDIAIIKLPEPVNLSTINAVTAKLFAPNNTNWYPNKIPGTAMGWGFLKNHGVRKKGLRKADITTMTLWNCRREADKLKIYSGTMRIPDVFCGIGEKKPSTSERPQICNGDSGGPLFIKAAHGYVQMGINVWTDSRCDSDFNGFLRIADHIEFVKKTVGPDHNLEISKDFELVNRTEIINGKVYSSDGGDRYGRW